MVRLLIVFAFICIPIVHAEEHVEPKKRHVDERTNFDKTIEECFTKTNWAEKRINYSLPESYQQPGFSWSEKSLRFNYSALQGLEHTANFFTGFFSDNENYENAYSKMELFAKYIERHAKDIPETPLKNFRKSCMILCVASNYLTYGDADTKGSALSTTVKEEAGDCLGKARFADYLAGLIGIKSQLVVSKEMLHTYVKFKIDGSWYYADPVEPYCEFLKQKE